MMINKHFNFISNCPAVFPFCSSFHFWIRANYIFSISCVFHDTQIMILKPAGIMNPIMTIKPGFNTMLWIPPPPSNLQDQKDRIYSTVRSQSTSATVNNLKPSTAYVFQIRAFTEAGYGTFGPRLEITTKEEETGRLLQNCVSNTLVLSMLPEYL